MKYKSNPADNLETTIVLLAANSQIKPNQKIDILQRMSKDVQAVTGYVQSICDYYVMNKFLQETSSYDRDGFVDAQQAVIRSDRIRKNAHDNMMKAVRDLNNISVNEAKGVIICEKEYLKDRWTMTDFATNLVNGLTQKEFDLENPSQDKLVNKIENKEVYLKDAERKLQELAEKYGMSTKPEETEELNLWLT